VKTMGRFLSGRFDSIMDAVDHQTRRLTMDERALLLRHVRDQLATILQAIGGNTHGNTSVSSDHNDPGEPGKPEQSPTVREGGLEPPHG
jgi:hypothetical protein